jgi:hypothetical protein
LVGKEPYYIGRVTKSKLIVVETENLWREDNKISLVIIELA